MACDSFLEPVGCDSARGSPLVGWLSPRISFSSFAELDNDTFSRGEAYDAISTDFDFSMGMSNLNSISEGIMHTADELFYNGKLLPLQLSNQFRMMDSQSLASSHNEDTESPKISDHHSVEEQKVSPALRQPSSNFCSSPRPSAGACFAPPSPETPKCSIMLRDLFGANKGQVTAIRESSGKLLATPKAWKNLVKGVIAAGKKGAVRSSVSEESSKVSVGGSDIKASNITSSHVTAPHPSVSSRIPCPTLSSERQQRITSRDSFQRDLEPVENSVSPGRILARAVQRSGAASADDCNTFPCRKKALSYRSISMPSSRCTSPERESGKSNAHKAFLKGSEKVSTGSTGRVNSGKIIMKNLERCSTNQKTPVKFQEQCNGMQHREYWRAPEKVSSYTSNVRVTPVLNVPVCMAPSVRNSKLAKGRFSSFKELLFSPKKETES